jgi:hypothetical protein
LRPTSRRGLSADYTVESARPWSVVLPARSVWLVPFLGGVLGAVLGLVEPRLDEAVSLPEAWQ